MVSMHNWLRSLVLLIVCGGVVQAELPERKTFQFGKFMIEASAGDEAYVEAVALQLVGLLPPEREAQPRSRFSFEDLTKRREYFLSRIAVMIGLAQPTDKMGEAFDRALLVWRNYYSARIPEVPLRYALWREAEVLARMAKGETVAGFGRDQRGELALDFSFLFHLGPNTLLSPERIHEQMIQVWREYPWPLLLGEKSTLDTTAAVARELHQLGQVAKGVSGLYSQALMRSCAFDVIRKTTEAGVAADWPATVDQRWFLHGAAHYVTTRIIENEVGKNEAKAYYDLAAELAAFSTSDLRIDLTNWPAAADPNNSQSAAELGLPYGAFATKVIADICAKHGDGLLPKLFTEVARNPRERVTSETVYRAFKKLTREDLRSYLSKGSSKR